MLNDEQISAIYHIVTGQTLREQDKRFALPFARFIESIPTSSSAEEIKRLRALLRECLPALSGHLRDKVMQTLGSE